MKAFAITSLLSLVYLLATLPFTHGEADHYKLEIEEKGTRFSEEIDVNEKGGEAVFRVPSHNNVDGADFYHDFKMRKIVTRIPSRKVCYISEMDSSLSSPSKLKKDLKRATLQPGKLSVTRKSHMRIVTGPANRFLLTKQVLEFCGYLPIYNTEISLAGNDTDNGNAIFQTGRLRRQVGDVEIRNFTSCTSTNPLNGVKKCFGSPWNATCRMKSGSCYYWVTCKNREVTKDWFCKEIHLSYRVPACCDFVCAKKRSKRGLVLFY